MVTGWAAPGRAEVTGPGRPARGRRPCRRAGHRSPGAPAGGPPRPGDAARRDLHDRPAPAVGPPRAPADRPAGARRRRRARLLLRGADPARGGRPAGGARHRPPAPADLPALRPRHPVRPPGAGLDRDVGGRVCTGGTGSTRVLLRGPDGEEREVAVDTVVFTGDFIPDNELARLAGLSVDPGTRGPACADGRHDERRWGLRGRQRRAPGRDGGRGGAAGPAVGARRGVAARRGDAATSSHRRSGVRWRTPALGGAEHGRPGPGRRRPC